jgi:hypothetical protein
VKLTKERKAELLEELGFLGICELALAYSATTDMAISWKHERVTVAIKLAPKPKKAKAVKS